MNAFALDSSILRVDDDYYIATSTFEWFRGVQIILADTHARGLNRLTQRKRSHGFRLQNENDGYAATTCLGNLHQARLQNRTTSSRNDAVVGGSY